MYTVTLCMYSNSEVSPDKRSGLWWVWPYKRSGLWWVWPDKRSGLWLVCPYKRGGLCYIKYTSPEIGYVGCSFAWEPGMPKVY
jgi:hypothetical protein